MGPENRRVVRQMGEDGWLGIGWPKEYGGQGRSAIEQFIFFDESMRAGAPVPDADHQHGRAHDHAVRHRRAEELLPARDPAGRDPLLHRILRAGRRDGPGRLATTERSGTATSTSSTARRCGRRWPETPTTSGWPPAPTRGQEAQGHLDVPRRHEDTRRASGSSLCTSSASTTSAPTFFDDVRVPAANLVGGENNGWTLITNQLNHERVTLCSPGMIDRCLDGGPSWAQYTGSPTVGGSSIRSGCSSTWPGCGPDRVPAADQLEGGLGSRRRSRLDPPTPPPTRCSAPSCTWRRSGC